MLINGFSKAFAMTGWRMGYACAPAPIIEQMLSEPEKPAPAFFIDPSVTDFYAFTKDSFRLEGYEPCPFEAKIPIAV